MASTIRVTPKKRSTQGAKRPDVAASAVTPVPTREGIAQRAHELYESSGRPGGRDVEFWLEAERQLRESVKV